MSKATLNGGTQTVAERATEAKLPLAPFTVHELRRTGSTILNELGFNSDWTESGYGQRDFPACTVLASAGSSGWFTVTRVVPDSGSLT